jgi:beta-N-acetylhexosaminidase
VNVDTALQRKIGQLLAVGIHGTDLSDARIQQVIQQAEAGLIGGVIIYRYNIVNREQLTELLQGLQRAKTQFPLLVFVDQEGGKIQRIDSSLGFHDTPSAQDIANSATVAQARQIYADLGQELHATGFNVDLAPCVDLDDDPSCPAIGQLARSYGTDPELVADYGQAMINGLKDHGVFSCIKHYPGHGRARGDSHTGLLDITNTWSAVELEPFKRLVERGVVDAVMTSHLVHQDVDHGTPVTFSRHWLQRLRNEVGFDGLIVADDLHMGAIISHYSLSETVIQGLNAGLDQLMFSNNPLAAQPQGIRHDVQADVEQVVTGQWQVPDPGLPEKINSAVLSAISDGRLTRDVIEHAYQRVTALKATLNTVEQP